MTTTDRPDTPVLLRGDVLNWLRPECVLRPTTSAISRRARVALQAVDLGRVTLSESFLRNVLERLVEHPAPSELDQIVMSLKGTGHQEVPSWPYTNAGEFLVPLPQERPIVSCTAAGVPGGALAVLAVEAGAEDDEDGESHQWKLIWFDRTSAMVESVVTLERGVKGPTLMALGCEEEAPLAVIHGDRLIRFDAAGRPDVREVPLFGGDSGIEVTAACLHPDTAELIIALYEDDITHVLRVRDDGVPVPLIRYPGQINNFAVGPGLIVGLGLRDIITVNLEAGQTALRDLHPYFADHPFQARSTAIVCPDGAVLVQEGRKVLRLSSDLRLVETEFLMDRSEESLSIDDFTLIRTTFFAGSSYLRVTTDEYPVP
ncbi:MAG: hypothetical protein CMH54_11790 [Myxococcales bacterium]|nr:hypothetical protein [Myxococcales bacterium]